METIQKQVPFKQMNDVVHSAQVSLREFEDEKGRLTSETREALEKIVRQETSSRIADVEKSLCRVTALESQVTTLSNVGEKTRDRVSDLERNGKTVASQVQSCTERLANQQKAIDAVKLKFQGYDSTQGDYVEWQDKMATWQDNINIWKEKTDQTIKNQENGFQDSIKETVKESLKTVIKNGFEQLRAKDQEYVQGLVGALRGEMTEFRKTQEKELASLRAENEKLKKSLEKSITEKRMPLGRTMSGPSDIKAIVDMQSTLRDLSIKLDDVRDKQLHLERQMVQIVPPVRNYWSIVNRYIDEHRPGGKHRCCIRSPFTRDSKGDQGANCHLPTGPRRTGEADCGC